jgi:hypothetical protein
VLSLSLTLLSSQPPSISSLSHMWTLWPCLLQLFLRAKCYDRERHIHWKVLRLQFSEHNQQDNRRIYPSSLLCNPGKQQSYGIKAVNDTVYNYMNFACYMYNGCLDQYTYCLDTNRTSLSDYAICTEAEDMCRDNVESPHYEYSGRGVYEIKHPYETQPPTYFTEYLIWRPSRSNRC